MLYKIRCNPMHPLNGALTLPYGPVRVKRGALVAHRYTYAPPCCRTSQCSRTFIPLSVSLWNDLVNPVFDGVELEVSRVGPMLFYWPKLLYPYYNCGAGVFGPIGCISLSLSLALPTFFNNNNNNNNSSIALRWLQQFISCSFFAFRIACSFSGLNH